MSEYRFILEEMYRKIKTPYMLFNPVAQAGAVPEMDPLDTLSDE